MCMKWKKRTRMCISRPTCNRCATLFIMEGNLSLSPRNRLLLAASVFAAVAFIVFFLVWKWPAMFGIEVADEAAQEEMTTEEKLNVLAQIRLSDPEAFPMTVSQKAEALEGLSAGSSVEGDTATLDNEQKLNVLGSLNAQ
jgi:type II secretory pathway component PulM